MPRLRQSIRQRGPGGWLKHPDPRPGAGAPSLFLANCRFGLQNRKIRDLGKAQSCPANTVQPASTAQSSPIRPPCLRRLPPPWPLDKRHRPVWEEIIHRIARDEWHAIDLRFAWQLTNTLVALHDEERRLNVEGSMVLTEKESGRTRATPSSGSCAARRSRSPAICACIPRATAAPRRSSSRADNQAEQEARDALSDRGDGAVFLATVLPKH